MWKHTTHHPVLNKIEHSENQRDVRSNDGHTLEAEPHVVASYPHMNSGASRHTEQRKGCRDIQMNLWQATWLGQLQAQGKIWYHSYLTSFLILLWSWMTPFHTPVSLGTQMMVGNEKGSPQGWNLTNSHHQWTLPLSWKEETCHLSQPLRDFCTPSMCFYSSPQLSQTKSKLFQGYELRLMCLITLGAGILKYDKNEAFSFKIT